MFGWRRKRDGFEWRRYVRTTILVKRQRRREQLDEARQAALDGLAEAGRKGREAGLSGIEAAGQRFGEVREKAGVAGGKLRERLAVGAKAAGSAMRRGAGVGLEAAGRGGRKAGAGLMKAAGAAARGLGRTSGSGVNGLAGGLEGVGRAMSPRISLPLLIAGLAAGAGAASRAMIESFDGIAVSAALLSSALLLLAMLPLLSGRATLDEPFKTRRVTSAEGDDAEGGGEELYPNDHPAGAAGALRAAAIALVVLALGGVAWFAAPLVTTFQISSEQASESGTQPTVALPSMPSIKLPRLSTTREEISGFAKSLTGDTMIIDDQLIVLADVEAPENRQSCRNSRGRQWSCGRSALNALRRITGYDTVSCSARESDAAGRKVADCTVKGKNIAEELVRDGHLFTTINSARYAEAEREAKAEKRGIWQGEAERPSDFRARRWELAKLRAPEGCPIKGKERARSGKKVYILPWSARYESYRVSERSGDRWFCSEDEALRAGWTPLES